MNDASSNSNRASLSPPKKQDEVEVSAVVDFETTESKDQSEIINF